MADGSVIIGVTLDTSTLAASAANFEMQISSLGQRISTSMAASLAADGVGASFGTALSGVTTMVSSMAENISSTMRMAAVNAISSFASAGWQNAGSAASAGIAGGVTAGAGQVNSAVRGAAESAKAAFSSGGWSSIGHQMMAGIAAGITATGSEVVAAIKRVSAQAEAAVKSYYKIQSPSALMRDEVGVMISRGIAEGILSGSSYVSGAMASVYAARECSVSPGNQQSSRSITQNIYLRDDDASPYRTARRIRRESEAMFRV